MHAAHALPTFRLLHRLTAGLLLLAGMLLASGSQAEDSLAALLGPALDATDLDQVRGGSTEDGGLNLGFVLEHRSYVNGNLESRTSFYPADPQALLSSPADLTSVLQNSLDQQQLQSMTLLEVRLSGFDPAAATRFESLQNVQIQQLRH